MRAIPGIDESQHAVVTVGADISASPRRPTNRTPTVAAACAEAVFLPGDPGRQSTLALWHPHGTVLAPIIGSGQGGHEQPGRPAMIDLVLPAGHTDNPDAGDPDRVDPDGTPGAGSRDDHESGDGHGPGPVRIHRIEATLVPIGIALPWLVRFTPDQRTPASLAAWMVAFRLAADLVARGRLHPGITASGLDTWRVGPLDPSDEERLAELVARFPAGAHATPLPGHGAITVPEPLALVRAAWDAVADTVVRTPAATAVTPGPAFAAPAPTDVSACQDWLEGIGHGFTGEGARPVLRLDLPDFPAPRYDDEGSYGELGFDEHQDGDHRPDDGRPNDDRPEDGRAGHEWFGDEPKLSVTLQLRSHADPSLLVDVADLWDAPTAVLQRLGGDTERDLLLALRRGARLWAPLARALDQARPGHLDVSDEEALALLGETAEDLGAAGFEVLWPALLDANAVRVRAVVSTPSPEAVTSAGLTLGTLTTFSWQAALGGDALTAEEVEILAEAKRPLVRLRGQWVLADPKLRSRLLRAGREPQTLPAAEALAAALTGVLTVDGEVVEAEVHGVLADVARRLRDHGDNETTGLHELGEPDGLVATLRPYQRRGLAWLADVTDLGLGGCLADDMGLGKTIQLIALHLHRHRGHHAERGPTLVVCPTSLLGNWERELRRFAPGVPVRRYHGDDRHLDAMAGDEVVLVTYGVLRRDSGELAATAWDLVVADEAQHVKNPLARTARALRTIPATARVAMTGTPVENRLSDLWALIDWTTPGLLGTLDQFRERVAIPVERNREPEATDRFARLVRPFLLRRRKVDPGIAPELPPKTETDQFVALTAEQATLYEAMVRETLALIAGSKGIQRRGLVLKLLTGLKQITNHPAQFLHQTGPLPARSGKLAVLDELVDAIVDAGDSVLVFSQYVEMCRLIEAHLASRWVPTLFLHGAVSAVKREQLVERFQAGEVPVFLLSLRAGGTGLNLTRASHVVHYDRWWNPAVEDQATDRAYRIGQEQPVQVHRLISEGTIEDRIAVLLNQKRALAEAVVGAGEAWIGELSDTDLADLVSLGTRSVAP